MKPLKRWYRGPTDDFTHCEKGFWVWIIPKSYGIDCREDRVRDMVNKDLGCPLGNSSFLLFQKFLLRPWTYIYLNNDYGIHVAIPWRYIASPFLNSGKEFFKPV